MGKTTKLTTQQFIERARKIHNDKYDYSKVEYVNNRTIVCIICPIHGEFWQIPQNHLNCNDCPKCAKLRAKQKLSLGGEQFIKKAREIHGDKYDYSKVEYINCDTKVCIICSEHGEFEQTPLRHLKGRGCFKCGIIQRSFRRVSDLDEFIKKAREIHGDKYDYSKVEYINSRAKICIICTEHGEFWQKPNDHLQGAGCPKCNQSHLERDVMKMLEENNIKYECQKTFEWLKYKKPMRLDFYLPEYNIAIECQGGQHFFPVDIFGGEDKLKEIIKRDELKKRLCEEHNIKMIYYSQNKKYCEINIIQNLKELIINNETLSRL